MVCVICESLGLFPLHFLVLVWLFGFSVLVLMSDFCWGFFSLVGGGWLLGVFLGGDFFLCVVYIVLVWGGFFVGMVGGFGGFLR